MSNEQIDKFLMGESSTELVELNPEIDKIKNSEIALADDFNGDEKPSHEEHIIQDYLFTRKTLQLNIEIAQESLKQARIMAQETGSPMMMANVASLLKVISENTAKLNALHKAFIKDNPKIAPVVNAEAGSNVIFASTSDMIAQGRDSDNG